MSQHAIMSTETTANGSSGGPEPQHDFPGMVRTHQKALFYFILSLVRDRQQAEDLTQEVFMVAHRRRHDFQPGGPVAAWLYGIARNLVLAELRQRRRRPVPLDQTTLVSLGDAFAEAQATTRHADDWLVGIEECMGRLDEKNRKLLALRYKKDMSVDEISRDMGVGLSALKMRLMRLRQRLAECLNQKRGEHLR